MFSNELNYLVKIVLNVKDTRLINKILKYFK